jgi:hypothetical protein
MLPAAPETRAIVARTPEGIVARTLGAIVEQLAIVAEVPGATVAERATVAETPRALAQA